MFANLSDIIKIPAAVFAGMFIASMFLIVTYEGISLPLVGQVIDGRVATRVKAATSAMVTTFERDTLASQLAEERRRTAQAAQITEEYRKRADAAQRQNAETQDKLEKAIAEDTGTDSPMWGDRDVEWLCQHGSKAPQCSR